MVRRAPALAFALLLVAVSAACGTTTSSVPPSNGAIEAAPSAAADPTDCQARIERATFDDLQTIDRVEACRFTKGGVEAAAAVLSAGGPRDAIWSALWIYDDSGADAVRPYLDDGNSSLRVIAAAIMARLGEREALTILGSLASDEGVLLGSHPQVAVGEFAIRSLARVIAAPGLPSLDVDPEALGPAAQAWQGWLESNGALLRYAPDAGEWNR